MNKNEILSHCVIVEIAKCEDEKLWYADLVGKQFVVFGISECEDTVYCCHIENSSTLLHPLPLEDITFIQGDVDYLYEMD